jgi:dUTP pyrophosphatase
MRFEKVSFEQYMSASNVNKSHEEIYDEYLDLKLPHRATKKSAGYDFFAPWAFTLKPGESIKIPSGIRVLLDDDKVLQCYPRSGLGFKYRLQLDNSVGIIDADYSDSDNEGHIFFKITNDSRNDKTVTINRGDAFAQGIIMQYFITEDDNVTTVRNGGMGSTSK